MLSEGLPAHFPALLPPYQPTPPTLDATGAFVGECSLCFELSAPFPSPFHPPQATDHPGSIPSAARPLSPLPLLPTLLLVVLESRPEKGRPAQDGSDEHHIALTFMQNIVLTGARVASDERKGPVCAQVTYVLLHPKKAKTVLHGSTSTPWRDPSLGRSLRTRTIRSSASWCLQMLEEYSAYRCLALRCPAQSRSGDGGIEGGADMEVQV